jgi:ketosteroid isomerase-like protein
VALAGCSRTVPEEALRETIGSLQHAVEARDPDGVADVLADDFIGPDGMDRDGARRLAALYMLRRNEVTAVPGPLDVDVQGDHARVRFTVALAAGASRFMPDTASVYAVDTGWRLDGGDWTMTSARWEPAMR